MYPPTTNEQKQKHQPDVDFKLPHSVEVCSERLEAWADANPDITAQVALLPQDGTWNVSLHYSKGNPYLIDFLKVRFDGAFSRTKDGGTHFVATSITDVATYVTRGIYLMTLGPLLLLVALRIGFRFPVIWLVALLLLAGLFYMLAWHPERARRSYAKEIAQQLEQTLR